MGRLYIVSGIVFFIFILLLYNSYNLYKKRWFKFRVWHIIVGVITFAIPILNLSTAVIMFCVLPPCLWLDGDYELRWRNSKIGESLSKFFKFIGSILNKEIC